jgi:hypothetical protein
MPQRARGGLRARPVAPGPRLRHAGAGAVARSRRPVRVVCPDVVGRGRSDWLRDPHGLWHAHLCGRHGALLASCTRRRRSTLDWVGTSMGGLIGMARRPPRAAAARAGAPAGAERRRPGDPVAALQRIGTYLGKTGRFESCSRRPMRCGRSRPPSVRTRPAMAGAVAAHGGARIAAHGRWAAKRPAVPDATDAHCCTTTRPSPCRSASRPRLRRRARRRSGSAVRRDHRAHAAAHAGAQSTCCRATPPWP